MVDHRGGVALDRVAFGALLLAVAANRALWQIRAVSRFGLGPPENGLGGPVPWENIGGRAEFITFSLDGTTELLNPLSWFRALRGGRAGDSLRGSTDSEESSR